MNKTSHPVLTIGHSSHSMAAFAELLCQHTVTEVADVRSSPYSRFNPQFNREALGRALEQHRIKYVFLGRELGARSKDRSCYENGRVQYSRLAKTNLFRDGIKRIIQETENYRIALMCAEKEPLECHRTLLVARVLDERGIAVEHILSDGQLEPHSDAMDRLLDITHLPREDLFMSRQKLVAEALNLQGKRIAYKDEKLAAQMTGEMP